MKGVYIIWALYVLVLSVLPCADGLADYRMTDAKEETVVSDVHEHSHSCTDGCSPFCHCNCCGVKCVVFTGVLSTIVAFSEEELPENVFFRSPELPSPHVGAVWQPPQATLLPVA